MRYINEASNSAFSSINIAVEQKLPHFTSIIPKSRIDMFVEYIIIKCKYEKCSKQGKQ